MERRFFHIYGLPEGDGESSDRAQTHLRLSPPCPNSPSLQFRDVLSIAYPRNLRVLRGPSMHLVALTLKAPDSDGAPARVVAKEEDASS